MIQMPPSLFNSAGHRPIAGVAAGLALALFAAGCGGRDGGPAASGPTAPAPIAPAATTAPDPTTPPAAPITPPTPTSTPTSTSPSTSTGTGSATASQPAPRPPGVWFATPQAAMRYLAGAYNRNDAAALKKVTTPDARAALQSMRQEATNLHLTRCTRQPRGDYVCAFSHDYPPGAGPHDHGDDHAHRGGSATFLAAPATKQGWYMTVLIACG
jgi:hypothetical protein